MPEPLLSQIVAIAVFGVFAQWTAWKTRTPAIIYLLAFGFILGPLTGVIQPERLLGELLPTVVSGAVAIILFEGSMQLRIRDLREVRSAVRHVIFFGAPIGWLLISVAAHYIAGLEWAVAITLGGMLIVTGPTVIMPLLRHARLTPRVGAVLKWEGIVNDPVGVIFAILAYEYFVSAEQGIPNISFIIDNLRALVTVIIFSFATAVVVRRIFDLGHMPEYLKTPFLFAIVLTLFAICNSFLHESGLIAVTLLGLSLTNMNVAGIDRIKQFKETITLMLVSGVFILLTADLDASVLLHLDWRGMAFIFVLLLFIRPLTLVMCSIGTSLTRREILFSGLIAPRGVVCAAMAGVLGPMLSDAGYLDGDQVLPISFAIVVVSVVLHSLIARPLAKVLRLTTTETNGVIFAGSYPWLAQLAETLKARGVPVMLVDSQWSSLGKARLADLPVYYGELLADDTEYALEFNKYNTMIVASPNPAHNALVCEKFGHEFGMGRVFAIVPDDSDISSRRRIPATRHGSTFVSRTLTPSDLWEKYQNGWRFRTTRVGKPKGENTLIIPEETERKIIVGIISSKSGLVSFYSPGNRPVPKEDDFVILWEKELPKETPKDPPRETPKDTAMSAATSEENNDNKTE